MNWTEEIIYSGLLIVTGMISALTVILTIWVVVNFTERLLS